MKKVAINIGNKIIGYGLRPMIIAEMSGNHNGNLNKAIAIVRAAAASGADAIKLQTYTPDTLTIDSRRPEFFIEDSASVWHGRRLWDLYAEAHTPWEWHEPIFEIARSEGLACISTAFDHKSLEFLLSIGVDAIKISSFELIHIPLIEQAARSNKPLMLSTGMATVEEINEAVAVIRGNGCDQFVLLKCTSAYPSIEKDANILTINDMRQRYGCEVGLSDHTISPYAALASTAHGAVLIEKHFTIARSEGGIDSSFSIEPSELYELVKGTELVWQSLGDTWYGSLSTEDVSLRERPSIYVVRPIKKGELFTEENIRVIRPADGLAPKHYGSIIGKRCVLDIESEMPMSWIMIE